MGEQTEVPMLMEMMFGEAAGQVRRAAATETVALPRLMAWCKAFDEWLAERKLSYKPGITRTSVPAWRRLLVQCGKMPWELEPADIEGHAAWMQREGYSPSTIHISIGIISNFYRWCGKRGVDAECGAGFDPASGAPRPVIKRWDGAKLLSPAEAQALLGILRRDESPLGRRDYAFTLARLGTGVPLEALRGLQWGQIEADGGEVWVRWRPEAQPQPLTEEVWEAITAYLTASGRMAGMQAKSYIFAPTVQHISEAPGSTAKDWREGCPLSREALLNSLKLYGRLAGIPEDKLTLRALRNTAIRLRLDAGESLEGMQAFLDREGDLSQTKYQLGCMSRLAEEGGEEGSAASLRGIGEGERGSRGAGERGCGDKEHRRGGREEGSAASLKGIREEGGEVMVPSRRGRLLRADGHIKHGLYARNLPSEEVLAVAAENIQGVDEEFRSLRTLARGLLQLQDEAGSAAEAARLGESYSQAAGRLAGLIKAEQKLAECRQASASFEERLDQMDRAALEMGEQPIGELVRAEALGEAPKLEIDDRRLVEEIASMRLVLRKTFGRALEAEDIKEYIRWVEVYGLACSRLMRLLMASPTDSDRLERCFSEAIIQAIREVGEEMGIYDSEPKVETLG